MRGVEPAIPGCAESTEPRESEYTAGARILLLLLGSLLVLFSAFTKSRSDALVMA